MLKDINILTSELEFSLQFVCDGKKGFLEINEFLEFHYNMYWVQPKENLTQFYKLICDLWNFY